MKVLQLHQVLAKNNEQDFTDEDRELFMNWFTLCLNRMGFTVNGSTKIVDEEEAIVDI